MTLEGSKVLSMGTLHKEEEHTGPGRVKIKLLQREAKVLSCSLNETYGREKFSPITQRIQTSEEAKFVCLRSKKEITTTTSANILVL